jgi:hypothetical protein
MVKWITCFQGSLADEECLVQPPHITGELRLYAMQRKSSGFNYINRIAEGLGVNSEESMQAKT